MSPVATADPARRSRRGATRTFSLAIAIASLGWSFPGAACQSLPSIYFGLDSLAVDAAGQAQLSEFAAEAQSQLDVLEAVELVGHSERLGTAEARARIGLARAEAVRDLLLALGMPERLLRTRSAADTAPQVETDDNVREPRNRRVDLRLTYTPEALAAQRAERDAAIAAGRPVPLC
ncbi:OmpA family protein [Sphingomonas parva]|uniref:OmpA family protein n=1 Tax=Sphingomonas parva TaxID=2555898 RepID=A0A4Y8ZSZ9_9SPHN|nr:OmpA family protein [Sphingomonas parva]TFI57586.1 OmpA family protein [Sphingomonas parva]